MLHIKGFYAEVMEMPSSVKRLKYACYATNVSMAVVACLSPLLFLTFRQQYGLSYTELGLLVLINFLTQLGVDLLLSFCSHKFDLPRLVKIIPVLTAVAVNYRLWKGNTVEESAR